MELVLVCTSDIAWEPDTLAKFVVGNKLLQGKTWVLISSGDACALRCAEAFASAMGSQVIVNYRWDGWHRGVAEPERLSGARYEVDWFQDQSEASVSPRLKWVLGQNPAPDRLVLVSREVMDILTRDLGLGLMRVARITVSERGQIACPKHLLEDEFDRQIRNTALKSKEAIEDVVAAKRLEPTNLPTLTTTIIQTVKDAFQGIRIKAQESPDFQSLLAELQNTLTEEVEKTVRKVDEHYSRSLQQATAVSVKAFEDLRNDFKGKMSKMQDQMKAMQQHQTEVKSILVELQTLIRSKPASPPLSNKEQTDRKVQELTADLKKIVELLPKLYAGLPEAAHNKRLPLIIEEITDEGSLRVLNRKQYTIEGLKLILLLDDREVVLKENFSMKPGFNEVMAAFPDDSGANTSLCFKQNDQEVCELTPLRVVSEADAEMPAELQYIAKAPLLRQEPKPQPQEPKPQLQGPQNPQLQGLQNPQPQGPQNPQPQGLQKPQPQEQKQGILASQKPGPMPNFPSVMFGKPGTKPVSSLSPDQEHRLQELEVKFGGPLSVAYRKKALELIKDPQYDNKTIEQLMTMVMTLG